MASKPRRRLVIDASVAQMSGDGYDARSVRCSDFLEAVYAICHRVVVTPSLDEEWTRHSSRFFVNWLARMLQKGKAPSREEPSESPISRDELLSLARSDRQEDEILKDAHLLAAAFVADRIVVSRDERIRAVFRDAAARFPILRRLAWVNPDHETPDLITWLERGAKHDPEVLLVPAD